MKLIVTLPPYNIGKEYERRTTLQGYVESQVRVIAECVRLLHPQGSICWQVGNHITPDGEVVPLDVVLYGVFEDHGLWLRNRVIWHFRRLPRPAARAANRVWPALRALVRWRQRRRRLLWRGA